MQGLRDMHRMNEQRVKAAKKPTTKKPSPTARASKVKKTEPRPSTSADDSKRKKPLGSMPKEELARMLGEVSMALRLSKEVLRVMKQGIQGRLGWSKEQTAFAKKIVTSAMLTMQAEDQRKALAAHLNELGL